VVVKARLPTYSFVLTVILRGPDPPE